MKNLKKKKKDINELIYKTGTDSQTWGTNLQLPRAKGGVEDRLGVWDGHVHTAVFNMDNQQAPTVWHRELFSVLCDGLYGERIFKKKKWTYVYVQLIHFAVHLKLIPHC